MLDDERAVPRALTGVEVALVVIAVIIGALSRSRGFTNGDLWFDDAWAASAARTGLGNAWHMFLTAPGYGFVQREWIRLDPTTTWWAQIPAFVFGVAAIPATWATARWMKFDRWMAVAAAFFIAVNPTLILYSTRVKEYPFDLLMALGLVVVAESVRRRPDATRWSVLVAVSVGAVLMSASMLIAVLGAWLVVAICVWPHRDQRRPFATSVAAVGVGIGATYVAFFRHVPAVLNFNWRRRGYLLDIRNVHLAERSIRLMFGGFAHSALMYPVPKVFYRTGRVSQAVSPMLVGMVVLAVVIAVPVVRSWRVRRVDRALVAAVTLAGAVAAALVDLVPFGDGRTDEVLYPSFVMASCAALTAAARWLSARSIPSFTMSTRRAVGVVLASALVIGSGAMAMSHTARYPVLSLRTLAPRLADRLAPGDVVVIDTFNSFGWCYYRLTPCHYVIGGRPVWPQGFRPTSNDATYYVSPNYSGPYPDMARALEGHKRVWYIGYTYGTFDASSPQLAHLRGPSSVYGAIVRSGWVPATSRGAVVSATNVFAQLLLPSSPH